MTGGSTVFFMASYSYLSDISNPKNRTTRFALMDGLFPIGFYIGNAIAGPVTKYLGFLFNFALGMLFAMLAVAYIVFYMKESSSVRDKPIQKEIEDVVKDLQLNQKFEGESMNLIAINCNLSVTVRVTFFIERILLFNLHMQFLHFHLL